MWYTERIVKLSLGVGSRMFWGEYSHHLDKKGRLIIPARYRSNLPVGAVLTRGLDRNLIIFPPDAWRGISEQLNRLPITDPKARALRRLMFSGMVELSLDRQGRILIPPYLRQYAALDGEVLIVGMETFIELWNPDHWQVTLDGVTRALAEADHTLILDW